MLYNVIDYQVIGDGKTNNTKALNYLMRIAEKTGGTVYFPAGNYVTGSIFLCSNITLYLDAGAVILGSACPEDYPYITQDQAPGYTRGGRCGLIAAFGCKNIAIHGKGTIDGRGYYWWDNVKHDMERPRTINPILCSNISIRDITIVNSPCWTVHPMCCDNITIDGVTIRNPYDSPNTDGINPESCQNVHISNCHMDVGDDCITIKSGTETDLLQKKYPCENITITNCTMAHGHGGVVIGSEMSGGVRNIVISNCVFQNTDRGIRLKTRRKRGGIIQGLIISNIVMDHVQAAITVNEYYFCGADLSDREIFDVDKQPINSSTPKISDICISGVIARNVIGVGIYMVGLPECPIEDIVMNNVDISVLGVERGIDAVAAPNREKSRGEGIFLENADSIAMNAVHLRCPREPYTIRNCDNIQLNGKELSETKD